MKRSEALNSIKQTLKPYVMHISDKTINEVLTNLENLGMLPPEWAYFIENGHGGRSVYQRTWEKEDE